MKPIYGERALSDPFKPVPWAVLDQKFVELASSHPEFGYVLAVIQSVRAVGAEDALAAHTSLHELVVVTQPIPDPPYYDKVVVRSPWSALDRPSEGCIIIEHLAVSGRNDRIERPIVDAVPLFWRFMIEKFGVDPNVIRSTH